ncbi:hypothetical protein M8J75_012314 [Diaphorina citri]|nr:hypothetical protein M8J75_012314 [Diaphorina citri]KAI5752390.1 hypothetical protein M8J77_016592 [Diaphorina citri]
MKFFAAVALLVVAVSANPLPEGSSTTTLGPKSSSSGPQDPPAPLPEVEAAICADPTLANVCSAKGVADAACKAIVEKVNGSTPECRDVGICSFTLPIESGVSSAVSGATTPSGTSSTTPSAVSGAVSGATTPSGTSSTTPSAVSGAVSGATTPSGTSSTTRSAVSGAVSGATTPSGTSSTTPAGNPDRKLTYYITKKAEVDGYSKLKACDSGVNILVHSRKSA